MHELAYDARLERLLKHGIGIWDVLAACHREGGLDSAIRNAKPNDFESLREHAPLLKKVCFNGKTSGRFAQVIGAASLPAACRRTRHHSAHTARRVGSAYKVTPSNSA